MTTRRPSTGDRSSVAAKRAVGPQDAVAAIEATAVRVTAAMKDSDPQRPKVLIAMYFDVDDRTAEAVFEISPATAQRIACDLTRQAVIAGTAVAAGPIEIARVVPDGAQANVVRLSAVRSKAADT